MAMFGRLFLRPIRILYRKEPMPARHRRRSTGQGAPAPCPQRPQTMRPGERLGPRTVVPHVRLMAPSVRDAWATRRPDACGGVQTHVCMDDAGDLATLHAALWQGQTSQWGLLTPMRPPGCLALLAWLQEPGVPLLLLHAAHRSPLIDTTARARTDRGALGDRRLFSPILVSTSGIAASPIGTLTQKIHCQVDPLDHRAAHERTAGDRQAGDRAEGADRRAALLRRERSGQQREARAA